MTFRYQSCCYFYFFYFLLVIFIVIFTTIQYDKEQVRSGLNGHQNRLDWKYWSRDYLLRRKDDEEILNLALRISNPKVGYGVWYASNHR